MTAPEPYAVVVYVPDTAQIRAVVGPYSDKASAELAAGCFTSAVVAPIVGWLPLARQIIERIEQVTR